MSTPATLPYKIATLCDLRDERGRVLLLRRLKAPNLGLCSPIGGKLDMATGESPAQAAAREIAEEAGITVPIERLHLAGLIAETAFEHRGHWLLFYYRVLGPVWVEPRDMREGRLEWVARDEIDALPLPETDRKIIWPLVWDHESRLPTDWRAMVEGRIPRPAPFSLHIDCSSPDARLTWHIEQEPGPLPIRGGA